MEIRHVLADQDYFLLVELKLAKAESQEGSPEKLIKTDKSQKGSENNEKVEKGEKGEKSAEKDPNRAKNTILKIHKKVHLRNVESLVDRSEPRNLIVGIVSSDKEKVPLKDEKDINEEMLLYFDNANKCSYVKNMLDTKKQTQRKRVVSTVKKYLEDCIVGNVVASTRLAL